MVFKVRIEFTSRGEEGDRDWGRVQGLPWECYVLLFRSVCENS